MSATDPFPRILGDVRLTKNGFTAKLEDGRTLVVDAGARFSSKLTDPVLKELHSGEESLEGVRDRLPVLGRVFRFAKRCADMLVDRVRGGRGVLVQRDSQISVRGDVLGRVHGVVDHDSSPVVVEAGAATPVDPALTVQESVGTAPGVGVAGACGYAASADSSEGGAR